MFLERTGQVMSPQLSKTSNDCLISAFKHLIICIKEKCNSKWHLSLRLTDNLCIESKQTFCYQDVLYLTNSIKIQENNKQFVCTKLSKLKLDNIRLMFTDFSV